MSRLLKLNDRAKTETLLRRRRNPPFGSNFSLYRQNISLHMRRSPNFNIAENSAGLGRAPYATLGRYRQGGTASPAFKVEDQLPWQRPPVLTYIFVRPKRLRVYSKKQRESLARFRNGSSPNGGRISDRRHYIFGYRFFGWRVGVYVFSASECRAQAQKCMDLAEIVRPTEKRHLLEIAHTWLKLVRQIEISDLATIVEMSSPPLTPTNKTSGLKREIGLGEVPVRQPSNRRV